MRIPWTTNSYEPFELAEWTHRYVNKSAKTGSATTMHGPQLSSEIVYVRSHGSVETAIDAGMVARPDKEHLSYAAETDRVLHTFNVSDFYQLHTEFLEADRSHAGLILVAQQRYTVGEHMNRVLQLSAERTASEMRNRVVFLTSVQE